MFNIQYIYIYISFSSRQSFDLWMILLRTPLLKMLPKDQGFPVEEIKLNSFIQHGQFRVCMSRGEEKPLLCLRLRKTSRWKNHKEYQEADPIVYQNNCKLRRVAHSVNDSSAACTLARMLNWRIEIKIEQVQEAVEKGL